MIYTWMEKEKIEVNKKVDYEDGCQLICYKTARMCDKITATVTGSLGF